VATLENILSDLVGKRRIMTSLPPSSSSTVAVDAVLDPAEVEVGISVYLNDDAPGFSAVLKARYSDFLVHEGTYCIECGACKGFVRFAPRNRNDPSHLCICCDRCNFHQSHWMDRSPGWNAWIP
jgi:hypothetical protein